MKWAAVFDVDGTMVDNRRHHEAAWLELGRRRGIPITPEFYHERMHSRTNGEIGHILLGSQSTAADIAVMSEEKETIYRSMYRPVLEEIAGFTAFLRELTGSGIPCATVSNSPTGNVDMVLDVLRIRHHFQCILDCTQVDRGKPDPDLLFAVAARLDIPVRRCLVFEDSVSGFAAAEAAGAPYVVVTAGADPAELHRAKRSVAMVRDFVGLSCRTCATWAEMASPPAQGNPSSSAE